MRTRDQRNVVYIILFNLRPPTLLQSHPQVSDTCPEPRLQIMLYGPPPKTEHWKIQQKFRLV